MGGGVCHTKLGSLTVARKLVDEVFCRFSPPEQLHSDQGRQFELLLLAEVCRLLGIHKTRTTAYQPQSDGLVEHWNWTLLHNLSTCVKDHPHLGRLLETNFYGM